MTDVSKVVARAFRKNGMSGVGDTLTADEIAEGVDTLNAMMHGWKLRGVDIIHTDVSATDTFPLANEYLEGAIYLLAARLSPDYSIPPSFDADDWFRTFQAAYSTLPEADMPAALYQMPSQNDRSVGS